jgi:hypothetical protein
VFAGHFYQEASVDKTITGLLAVASSFAIPAAHAASQVPPNFEAAMRVDSYADLLRPIPNAAALLKVSAGAQSNLVPGEQSATHHQSGWEEAPASPSSSSSSPPPPSPSSQLTWARGRQRCEPAPVLARGKGIRDRLPNAWFARE